MAEVGRDELDEDLAHQARLAGSRDAGHRGERAERELHVQIVEVVPRDAFEAQPAVRLARLPRRRRTFAEQVAPRLRHGHLGEPFRRTAVEDLPAVLAGFRADVHDPVGAPDHVEIVLDDKERVPRCLELVERPQQRFGVGGMQPRARLVEHVDDAEEIRPHLGGEAESLQLPGR